jgi:hypothetical protein
MSTAAATPRITVPTGERIGAGVIAGLCLTLLAVAAALSPDAAGHGTHEQLGLPPCGWLLATGYPCPTCGMTTAFAAAAEGDLLTSLVTQPVGALLAVATAATFWIALHVAVFGSRLGQLCGRLWRPRWLWIFAGAWAASWAYKIATWPAP